MRRDSLYTRSFRRIHFSVFTQRWTKNGFTGPKSFRGFRETGPWSHIYCVYTAIQNRNVLGPGQGSRYFQRMTKGTPGDEVELYKAFILPHFPYCSSVWHFCSAKNTEKIEALNKRILRFILDDFESTYIYLINQARGPYWENIGPRSWQYGPRCARSVQQRPRADILPVRSRASLVNKRFITRLKKANHSGQCPVRYLENTGPAIEHFDWLILVIGPLTTWVV